VSRLPRFQEHLKTGFTAEAVSAACFRAYAEQAERGGRPKLAARWRQLAEEKDRLATLQLEAAGKVYDEATALRQALAEEKYENDVLYPRMMRDVDEKTAEVFRQVVAAQQQQTAALAQLQDDLQAASGDI
jgi:rubrerythrin